MIEKITALVGSANPYLWGAVFVGGVIAGVAAGRWIMLPIVERAQVKAALCAADAAAIEARQADAQKKARAALAKAQATAKASQKQVDELTRRLSAREYRDAPAGETLDEIHRQWKDSRPPR